MVAVGECGLEVFAAEGCVEGSEGILCAVCEDVG